MRATIIDIDRSRGPLVRWGAIVAGAVWGLAVMAVLSSLWLALAFPSSSDLIRDNLEWFIAASGAASLFVAGLVAGLLTDNRGTGSGLLHGMTAWGMLLIVVLVFGLPSVFAVFSAGQIRTIDGGDLVGAGTNDALWATFLTLVIGAAAAAFGGLIGGASRRSVGRAGRDLGDIDGADARMRSDVATESQPRPDEDLPALDDGDRVMVRRADDGTYVDQHGRRFVPEPTSRTDDLR